MTDRLRTIIGYDRILVMSAGSVEEFDAPLVLFDKGETSTFFQMCVASGINRQDIVSAQDHIS